MRSLIGAALMLAGVIAGVPAGAVTLTYFTTLNGLSEDPPSGSPATGQGRVDIDLDTDFLRGAPA